MLNLHIFPHFVWYVYYKKLCKRALWRTLWTWGISLRIYLAVLHRSDAAHFPVKCPYYSSPKPVLLQLAVSLLALLLVSNSTIFSQRRHNKLTLASVVRTWRDGISVTSSLLEGGSAAAKACLQARPPFPLPQSTGRLASLAQFFFHVPRFLPFPHCGTWT